MRFGRQKEGRIPPDLTDDVDVFSEKGQNEGGLHVPRVTKE
jgi:hypothetical protein